MRAEDLSEKVIDYWCKIALWEDFYAILLLNGVAVSLEECASYDLQPYEVFDNCVQDETNQDSRKLIQDRELVTRAIRAEFKFFWFTQANHNKILVEPRSFLKWAQTSGIGRSEIVAAILKRLDFLQPQTQPIRQEEPAPIDAAIDLDQNIANTWKKKQNWRLWEAALLLSGINPKQAVLGSACEDFILQLPEQGNDIRAFRHFIHKRILNKDSIVCVLDAIERHLYSLSIDRNAHRITDFIPVQIALMLGNRDEVGHPDALALLKLETSAKSSLVPNQHSVQSDIRKEQIIKALRAIIEQDKDGFRHKNGMLNAAALSRQLISHRKTFFPKGILPLNGRRLDDAIRAAIKERRIE